MSSKCPCLEPLSLLPPPAFEDTPRGKEVRAWYDAFESVAGCDYSDLYEYAEGKYRETQANFDSLDKKAETFFTISTGLATLVFAGLKAFDLSFNGWGWVAFCLLLTAMVYSALVRRPLPYESPMTIDAALDHFGANSQVNQKALLAASYHYAAEATHQTCEWKARKLSVVLILICAAIFALAPALITAPHNPTQPTASQSR